MGWKIKINSTNPTTRDILGIMNDESVSYELYDSNNNHLASYRNIESLLFTAACALEIVNRGNSESKNVGILSYDFDKDNSIEHLYETWDQALSVAELAEARSRIKMCEPDPNYCFKLKQLDKTPDWFTSQISEIEGLWPDSVSIAEKICRVVCAHIDVSGKVDYGICGRVSIKWHINNPSINVDWTIEPSILGFPIFNIYQAVVDQEHSIKVSMIHDIYQAIRSLQSLMKD